MRNSKIYQVYTGLAFDGYYPSKAQYSNENWNTSINNDFLLGLESLLNIFSTALKQTIILESWDIANENFIIGNEGIWDSITKFAKKYWSKFTDTLKELWNKLFNSKKELEEATKKVNKVERELTNTTNNATAINGSKVGTRIGGGITKDHFLDFLKNNKTIQKIELDSTEKLAYGVNKKLNDLDEVELANCLARRFENELRDYFDKYQKILTQGQHVYLSILTTKYQKAYEYSTNLIKIREEIRNEMYHYNDKINKLARTEKDVIKIYNENQKDFMTDREISKLLPQYNGIEYIMHNNAKDIDKAFNTFLGRLS